MHQVGDQPRLYYDARSTNYQETERYKEYLLWECKVDGTWSGKCPLARCRIDGLETTLEVE